MLALPVIRLKPERAKSARAGHPWLFSGAFEALPTLEPGSLCRIEDDKGAFVAVGYANPSRSLAVRLLAWQEISNVQDLLEERIDAALRLRRSCIPPDTDAYRPISGEGDATGSGRRPLRRRARRAGIVLDAIILPEVLVLSG